MLRKSVKTPASITIFLYPATIVHPHAGLPSNAWAKPAKNITDEGIAWLMTREDYEARSLRR